MDSSSDGSFAWTDASHSNSEDSDMAPSQHVNGDLNGTESDSGKNYKNKLHQKLFKDHEHQENALEETQQTQNAKKRKHKKEEFDHYGNHDSPQKKQIKIEPQSDTDQGKRNKKINKHINVNDRVNDSCKSQFDDENELSMIIKQEQSSFTSLASAKKKKVKKENSYMSTNELVEKEYSVSSCNLNGNKDIDQLNSIDTVNRNKKSTKHTDVHDDSCKSQFDDESELSMIIKQEQSSFASPTPVKKKKSKKEKSFMSTNETGGKECSISSGSLNDCSNFDQLNTINPVTDNEPQESGDDSVHKKRKKKKKDKECINKYEVVVDKFEAEETIVELPEKKKKMRHSSNENTSTNCVNEKQRNVTNGISESESVDTEKMLNFSEQSMAVAVPLVQKAHNITAKRSSKMSDRILFEEDNTETETKTGDKDTGEIFTKYLEKNVDLKPIYLKPNDDCGITENDDIWVMKCPNDLDTKALAGIDLKLNGKFKVKIDGQKYEGNVEDKEDDSVHILTYNNKRFSIKKFPLKGTIALRKKIPVIKASTEITQTMVHNNITTRQPLIYDTKSWHPFFGSEFHKHIEPRSEVNDCLDISMPEPQSEVNDCLDISMPVSPIKKKKKKRNKEKRIDTEITYEEENNIKLEVESDIQPKNKKKRHRSPTVEETPKNKRHKKDHDSADVWESEKAIEENLFNF